MKVILVLKIFVVFVYTKPNPSKYPDQILISSNYLIS